MRKAISKRLVKATSWAVLCVLLIEVMNYGWDVRIRARRLPDCRWDEDRPYQETIPYMVRWCTVKREVIMVRLYDKEGQTLLAERMFDSPDWPIIYWTAKEVGYRTLTDWGSIALPPSVLDLWRTRLP